MSQPDEVEHPECPLCMEPLEVDDLNFFPCTCGYQICRFCWHRIRTDENGLCPACRKAYSENPADFKPLSQEQVVKMKAEKRQKDLQKKQKATESRKHLANVRVVQKNLVFVVGLPIRLADPTMLKKHDYFGKFGKIHKVVINQSTTYAGATGPSASAYVTYSRCDDALRAIQAVNNIVVDSRILKTSLGTTKYCSHFIKGQPCPKSDCMYLHDLGDGEASFTKEEMQQAKHQEYEKKLHDQLNLLGTVERKTASPPQGAKTDTWPSLNNNISAVVTPVELETKPAPPPVTNTAQTNGKGKRKDKAPQEKGKRKGKEKENSQSDTIKPHPLQSSQSETCIKNHALQTSQSESCLSSQHVQLTNLSNRASMIFENSSIYANGINSNSDMAVPPDVREEPSPPQTPSPQPTQAPAPPPDTTTHNGYHESVAPPSPPQPHMPDDELGFDPFQETQKGLADLLEKELALQQRATEAIVTPPPPMRQNNLYNLNSYSQQLDPAILNHLHSNQQQQHRFAGSSSSSRQMDRRPMPPPGFSAPLPPPPLARSQHELYARGINGTKPHQSFYYNNGAQKLSDWPENLRNLVHDSSIQPPHTLLQSHHHPNSINRHDKGWNNASNYADWTALDPAIVSTRPMGINVHSPPPNLYNPNMNGYGALGGLGMPGWQQCYQDAYFKTAIHNTSVPPPGFSLLHQNGSSLKPGLGGIGLTSGIETMD